VRRNAAAKKLDQNAVIAAAVAAAAAAAAAAATAAAATTAAAAAAAAAAQPAAYSEEDAQLTMQVAQMHTEKVRLERRLRELERENDHLHDEVEVLYLQVDEQSGMLDLSYAEAAEVAAGAAVEEFLLAGLEGDKQRKGKAQEADTTKAEGEEARVRGGDTQGEGKSPGLGRSSGGGGQKQKHLLLLPSRPGSPSPATSVAEIFSLLSPGTPGTSPSSSPAASPAILDVPSAGTVVNTCGTITPLLQRRQTELVESMDALRAERDSLSEEVAALRREQDNRHESAGGGGELEVGRFVCTSHS